MADIEFYNLGDYSKDVIATASIKNMECGKGKTVKRYALVKDYLLPPGSWPESLPPDECNLQYDEWISKLMDDFISSGLEVRPDENGVYSLKYTGTYKLFIEDSDGKYTVVSAELPRLSTNDTEPPNIDFDVTIPAAEGAPAEVKVSAVDNGGVARLDYADIELRQIGKSDNGTDEFFLTNRNSVSDGMIKTDRAIVICAVDKSGNASYKRVDIGDGPEPTTAPTAEPGPTETPDDYLYEISELSILTQSGEKLEAPPENGSFEAEVTVRKLKNESSGDYIFVAVYNEEGILLNIDYVRADFTPDYDCSFGFNIPAQAQKVGSVKAFAWNGFNSAKPLAETREINFQ